MFRRIWLRLWLGLLTGLRARQRQTSFVIPALRGPIERTSDNQGHPRASPKLAVKTHSHKKGGGHFWPPRRIERALLGEL
jgi:hypothetical protein